jgi:hypothetical protein
VNFRWSSDGVSFDNAAVAAGATSAPAGGYHIEWAAVDNNSGAIEPLGETTTKSGERVASPATLRDGAAFVRMRVRAVDGDVGRDPIDAYFRRGPNGWTLVGLDRAGTVSSTK